MGIRAGVAPGAVRLESSRTGPVVISLARSAIRSPHLGPIVRSGSGRLRGFCDTRPGSIEAPRHLRRCSDRGTTSSMAVQRGAPTGSGPLGLRLGLCALPLARSRSFRSPAVRQKVADLQGFPAMARPGLEPGTPRFSVVRVSLSNRTKSPAYKRHRTTFLSAQRSQIPCFPRRFGRRPAPRRLNVRECYLPNPDPALDCGCGGEAQWGADGLVGGPVGGRSRGSGRGVRVLSERPTPVPGAHKELHGPNSCDRSVECGPRRCRCGVNAPESRLGLETRDLWVRSRLLGA